VNPEYVRNQIEQSKMWAMYWHAQVTSGAYRLRDLRVGLTGGGERPLTDDEKLKDALVTMTSHIHRMSDLAETLAGLDKTK
jgi:hypothetical protein